VLNAFWLIPILPLLGFLINGLALKWMPRKLAGYLACASVGAAFLVAAGAFFGLRALPVGERAITKVLFPWIAAGNFHVNVAFLWDPLSAVMALVVSGVGFLIHVYSLGYMAHDPGYKRYFTYLNLFTFAMLILVLADNFLLLFVGWEGVGLCSYLLIGFWYTKDSASNAGKKAFIVNRIGDFGVLIGMFLLFWTLGSLTFAEVFHKAPLVYTAGAALPTAIALLFFLGATGKSAQIPLFVWLPDAMEGPTPVSALIHAATMVTAGVYLFVRASGLFALAPDALAVVAVIGALTAIFAATIGLVQNDIKRVLAYSTVSQLGYMFLAVGAGAYVAAIFHLMTHAFFKALLFLGSGSVIEACHHEQDMRKMGGLGKKLPITRNTFIIGSLALAGVPIFAGFFSKDEILYNTFTSSGLGELGKVLWVVGAAAALLTAFYITRAVAMTFFGEPRDKHVYEHAKESPRAMTVPLMILAVLSTVGGFLGLPLLAGANAMHNWLGPLVGAHGAAHGAEGAEGAAVAHGGGHSMGLELGLMAFSVAIAILGVWFGWQTYVVKPGRAKAMGARFAGMYKVLLNKYYVDEIYNASVVQPIVAFSRFLWKIVDVELIDGAVNGAGRVVRGVGGYLRPIQSGFVGSYAAAIMVGAILIMGYVLLGGGR
jgi:NADH-quinone oxidoreductase subunit L